MSKNFGFFLLFLSVPSFAANSALLTLSKGAGLIMPEYALQSECRIYADHVEIDRSVGNLVSGLEARNLQVNLAQVTARLQEAQAGKITETPVPSDIPERRYTGVAADGKEVLLLSRASGQTNTSSSAVALKNFLDMVCGESF